MGQINIQFGEIDIQLCQKLLDVYRETMGAPVQQLTKEETHVALKELVGIDLDGVNIC